MTNRVAANNITVLSARLTGGGGDILNQKGASAERQANSWDCPSSRTWIWFRWFVLIVGIFLFQGSGILRMEVILDEEGFYSSTQ
jgi:hypothetical protein